MSTPSLLDGEPGCPEPASDTPDGPVSDQGRLAPRLVAQRRDFGAVDGAAWDALAASAPAATPFSRHCVQKAWWDAYGPTAHDQTLVICPEDAPDRIVAIAPLMHRHALEPGDVAARTSLRHPTPPRTAVAGSATAVFFGASYHSDYATLLAPGELLPSVADAVVTALANRTDWDVVDLRRLRAADPAADALAAAFDREAGARQWRVIREQEDVCPVVTLPDGADFDAYLATLDKKERHEIRRKIRRAEAAGDVRLEPSSNPLADLDAFADLHQKRWGEEGLFPPTAGGAASRRFFAEMLEGCAQLVELSFLTVDGRRIAAGVTFDDGVSIYYYNAGVDPDARDLSPGVVMVARYVQRAIELGRRRLDFLRGDEPYKYAWGAVDEPVNRILVERTGPPAAKEN